MRYFSVPVSWAFLIFQVRKGDKIGEFLRAVQQQLAPEFREIRTTSVENLLYVKEDLIIPHVSFIFFVWEVYLNTSKFIIFGLM